MMAAEETYAVPSAFLEARTPHLSGVEEYRAQYQRSVEDPAGFWGEIAQGFHWETPWEETCASNFGEDEGAPIFTEWFRGGRTNICFNALDRHVAAGHGDTIAFYHEANDEGEVLPQSSWSYSEVLDEVSRLANVLRSRGVRKGDKVSLFMPMVPHLAIAMLACARIGAVHSVVFGGFSAEALAGRLIDAGSSFVITADGVMRGTKLINLLEIVRKAQTICADECAPLMDVLVLRRLSEDALPAPALAEGLERWWHDELAGASTECEVEWSPL
jgi:acetyl-CoA synthetase